MSTIGGGISNIINGSYASSIGGGQSNCIMKVYATYCYMKANTIGGGYNNKIYQSVYGYGACYNFIGGGKDNRILDNNYTYTNYNAILGGNGNFIEGKENTFIIGSNLTGNISNYTFVNNLCSAGQVNKAGGSFVINHPDPLKTKTTQLIHSFVESPTAGDNIYRFKVTIVDGIGEIILPDYYKFLNENTQVWISPINGFGIGYGEINKELTKIVITANLDIEYNVLVIGTRKDSHAKKHWKGTERLKP
jgi:hypothetical protein